MSKHGIGVRSDATSTSTLAHVKDRLGWSSYQWRLFVITGACIMAESIEVGLLSFLTIEGKREWDLSQGMADNIAGAVFLGEIVGTVFFGVLADLYGRKPAVAIGSALVFGFGLGSSFSRTAWELIASRFGVGIGIGGFSVPYDLLCEFCPNRARGTVMMSLWMWFAVGSLLVVQIASITLETQGWRWLCLYCSIPPALSGIGLFWVDESPNWLLVKGRQAEAEKILAKVAKMNGVDLGDINLEAVEEEILDVRILFRGEAAFTTLCLWMMSFAQCFIYYGIVMYLPRTLEVLTGTKIIQPAALGLKDLLLGTLGIGAVEAQTSTLTSSSPKASHPYWALSLSCVGEIIANMVAILTINSFSRGKLASFFFFGFAVTFPLLLMDVVDFAMVTCAMVARLCAANAGNITWLITPEAYPTHVRATGHSWANLLARTGAFCTAYWQSQKDTTIMAAGFSSVALLASLAAYHLPPGVMPGSNPLHRDFDRFKSN